MKRKLKDYKESKKKEMQSYSFNKMEVQEQDFSLQL